MTRQPPHGSRPLRWFGGSLTVIGLAALAVSCGGSGGDDSIASTPTEINAATVKTAAADAADFVPLCADSGISASATGSTLLKKALGLTQHQHERRLMQGRMRAQATSNSAPLITTGDCGGRYELTQGEPDTNGVASASLVFTDYCEISTDTGLQEVLSGSVTLSTTSASVNGKTVTSGMTAESEGVRTIVRTGSGASAQSDEILRFSGLRYQVGVPGGDPTAAHPNVFKVQEIVRTNNLTRKSYRQTGYSIDIYDTAGGGSTMAITGRGYRSNGESFEITTPTRIETTSAGAYVAGAMTFSGAGTSRAVVTLVPGATMQATLTINGEPFTENLPACAR